jgi:apolipoprotein N-acyltransferase
LLIKFKASGQSLETPFGKHSMAGIVGITAIFFFASLIYGHTLTSRPLTGKKVMVSVVQGNIAQSKKWDAKYASEIMQTYTELTKKASKDRPSLIIWPETATPRAITENLSLLWQIRRIAGETGIPLLIGSSERQKFKKEDANQKRKYLNSAFLIRSNPKTQKPQRYDKIRLLPFGEYLPLREKVPWHAINIPEISGFARGKEFTVFKLPDLRFGVTICWENIFPDVVREFVKKGAQVIINIGNEAWFGKSAAPYQFLSMNVFRAVENGVFVVRCTNTGVSCFIDSRGRIVDRVTGENNSDIFVRGILSNVVVLRDSATIYSRYGDFYAQLCLILSSIFILFAALKKTGTVT